MPAASLLFYRAESTRTMNPQTNMPEAGQSSGDESPKRKDSPEVNKAEEPDVKRSKIEDFTGWRVKLYRLNNDGSWEDCGTGRIRCLPGEPTPSLCVTAEENEERELLRTRVLLNDAYQRQGHNIITWCEPCYHQRAVGNIPSSLQQQEVDLALSFQDNEGCLDIWNKIVAVRQASVEDVAAQAAAQHHADLQKWEMPPQEPLVLPALTLENLDEVADIVAMVQQREALALAVGADDCRYFRELLGLFPAAEEVLDYAKLATLAACIKTILLVNDVPILEMVVQETDVFERVCASLEYDPDLREKANHRWFLKSRAKFRTVVPMHEPSLIDSIHRSFRVQYIKDTLLRPTMDESSLSTLSSLQTFTHSEVIKGITSGQCSDLSDSYLVRVVRVLATEVYTLQQMDWADQDVADHRVYVGSSAPSTPRGADPAEFSPWKQHLAPQDLSLAARRERRKGCLSFLRELFVMVRVSLQNLDKEDFFSVVPSAETGNLLPDTSQLPEYKLPTSTNLLLLLASLLLDRVDDGEKNTILEILAAIAMHDPGLIRRHCLAQGPPDSRPQSNEKNQVLFLVPPRDVMSALLFLLATETDAGALLQITETIRIVLDTDVVSENSLLNPESPERSTLTAPMANATEQRKFLTRFYEQYIEWLVAPFAVSILHPWKRVPHEVWKAPDATLERIRSNFAKGVDDPLLKHVAPNAIRISFAVDILGYCVRTHVYQARAFLLKSKTLVNVAKMLQPKPKVLSGDRCLKLAVLRLFRSTLSVNDEYYCRHIVQHDLFAYVFSAFRANPVGDNIVSSAVIELCAFVAKEEMRTLLEYIVTKHISAKEAGNPSLEEFSKPYVSTLTEIREAYEHAVKNQVDARNVGNEVGPMLQGTVLTGKALEDQRKFRQSDEEDSYFMDDADSGPSSAGQHPLVDEMVAQEKELHRTPRMFSLAQAPHMSVMGNTPSPSPALGDEMEGEELAL